VSSGAGNPYGHPARSTIDRLASGGARVLRTDTDGSVGVTIDPTGAIGVTTTGARRTARSTEVVATLARARSDPPLPPAAHATVLARGPVAFGCGIPSTG
jgi:competence protein ComEC